MDTEEVVGEVLKDENCKDNEIMFLLQCWRKLGCRAYFNYEDFSKAEQPRKLLELKDKFISGQIKPKEAKPSRAKRTRKAVKEEVKPENEEVKESDAQ